RRSLRGRQISRLVSCVRPLFFGHDLCPDRLSLPVQPIPGGWSWDRTAARWRCTRPHHAPASWTRWRHTAYDRLRPASCTGASSSVRFSVHGRPCCAPIRCCAPIQGLDIIISYSLKIRKLFSSRSSDATAHVLSGALVQVLAHVLACVSELLYLAVEIARVVVEYPE